MQGLFYDSNTLTSGSSAPQPTGTPPPPTTRSSAESAVHAASADTIATIAAAHWAPVPRRPRPSEAAPLPSISETIAQAVRVLTRRASPSVLDPAIPRAMEVDSEIADRSASPSRGPYDFSDEELIEIGRCYWGLGNDKWMEGVEAQHHTHGAYVFDRGLHGGAVEPGYHENWLHAIHFLSTQFNRKVDSRLYLRLHSIACQHFMGSATQTLMGPEGVGVFRGRGDPIHWNCSGAYTPTPRARQELAAMNEEIRQRFGTDLANFVTNSNGSVTLIYTAMSSDKVEAIYNYFASTLYAELSRAQNPDEKLTAICKFFRNCEWLHSVQDGCGRCDLMTFNFLLTQNGFHPVIMEFPYLASTTSLAYWVSYVREGLRNWEHLAPPRLPVVIT